MRCILTVIMVCVFSLPAFGQSVQENKRIDREEKSSLRFSEAGLPAKQSTETVDAREKRLLYFSHLYDQKTVSRSDACQVLIILLGMENRYQTEEEQIRYLREQHILPASFRDPFDTRWPLDKGLAAYMFARAMHLKGGLVMRLWGISQRYAFHELASMKMIPQGFERDRMTGKELVTLFTLAVDYLADQALQPPRRGE